jgi:hypothetical protein
VKAAKAAWEASSGKRGTRTKRSDIDMELKQCRKKL